MLDTKYLYKCKFCTKQFMKEPAFMKHECKEMKRSYEVQTVVGQQAYQLYKAWLEKQRRKPPPIETFATSTYYTAFIRFATFCRETKIADPELYVDLMVKENSSPILWSKEHFYQLYINHLEKHTDPYKQIELTVTTLLNTAEKLNVPVAEIFDSLRFGEVLQLLAQRKLSPWFLFCSSKFKAWSNRLDEHDRKTMMKQVGMGYWALIFEKRADVVKDSVLIARELGL